MNEVFFLELLNMGYMQTLKKPYQTVDSKFHWNFQNKFCMNVFEKQVSMELLALKSLWKFLGSSIINLNAKFCRVGGTNFRKTTNKCHWKMWKQTTKMFNRPPSEIVGGD